MSAHKAHVRFSFWKGKLLEDADGLLEKWDSSGITGMRLEKVSDLPTRRVLVAWITGAKRDATREKRIAQAVEWMAEGKPRNWKYMNC